MIKQFTSSSIENEEQLFFVLEHIHHACHTLCMQSLHSYLPIAGNIGIFSHSEKEYEALTNIQKTLTDPSVSVYGKYFKLHVPINILAQDNIPSATYSYLYIRKPDPTKPQIGDLDFYLEPKAFIELKEFVRGNNVQGARLLANRPELDLIELYNPAIDALGYIGDKQW